MKIMHIVGARPNFMKIAPIMREMKNYPDKFEQVLVHTGQHYDANMSDVFFDELELPKPDVNLEVGSGTHAGQTAQIMQRFEDVLITHEPDWIVVPGDVNSTIACALVASKLGVKIAHVEAGLRSFDRTMPEEINRVLTDQLSDLLFTPSRDGNENLLREGIAAEKIHFVGNIITTANKHMKIG
jgi:UDP-N-acetylglucosamine 2-epimerase (non-hydrolysing)